MNYLDRLAIDILSVEKGGISKVRFAKIIYLVHKELIRDLRSASDDLAYIRMPLGPVPDGFLKLHKNDFILTVESNIGLSYDRQLYKLDLNINNYENKNIEIIRTTLNSLKRLSTTDLIEYTHNEKGWLNHNNGEKYYITTEDLKRGLPKNVITKNIYKENMDIMQAQLVSGMIDDIVQQSTLLEYPSDTK